MQTYLPFLNLPFGKFGKLLCLPVSYDILSDISFLLELSPALPATSRITGNVRHDICAYNILSEQYGQVWVVCIFSFCLKPCVPGSLDKNLVKL